MDDTKWLALAIFLLSCLVTYMWCLLDKVSSELSEYKTKIDKRLDYTEEKCGDYKLDVEKGFILARDKLLELEKAVESCDTIIEVHRVRLNKLEGVKAPGKKTKKTKRKKS